MKKPRLYFFLVTLFSLGALTINAAQPASVKVINVSGIVSHYPDSATEKTLTAGTILNQGDSVTTAVLSTARLVFSNGSELTVEANSSITLATLTQEAFGGAKSYEQLQADPSKSQCVVELNYGKISGHVKRLRAGSEFNIETPLGIAAIRGTNYTVQTWYDELSKEFVLIVRNEDGKVDIISRYMGLFEYGRSNIAEKGFIPNISEYTSEPIPPAHTVIIRFSEFDPYYNEIIDTLKNYPPFQNDSTRPELMIYPPEPLVTPEDQPVQIVSPNTPLNNPIFENDRED